MEELIRNLPYWEISLTLAALLALCLLGLWRFRWRDYSLCRVTENMNSSLSSRDVDVKDGEKPVDFKDFYSDLQSNYHRPEGKMSVVIPVLNQASSLEKNLPKVLSQKYHAFEVVVVDYGSIDDTEQVVKRLSEGHSNLRYLPISIDDYSLNATYFAIVMGVRAAYSEVVVLTSADSWPADDLWLQTMSNLLSDDKDIVIGYANYANDGTQRARSAIYRRLRFQLRATRAALTGRPIGGEAENLCFRRQRFLETCVFSSELGQGVLEGPFLVRALATKQNVGLAFSPNATVLQELPSPSSVKQRQRLSVFPLSRRHWLYEKRHQLAAFLYGLSVCLLLSYVVLQVGHAFFLRTYDLLQLLPDILVFLCLILLIVLPIVCLRRGCRRLGELPFLFTT